MAFEKNVFVNCPFDPDYLDLLRPILFCILDLGFEPRIAYERFDSAESRIHKIIELISESKYGIHDLSRLKASKRGEYYRLNMPFELGIDYGCRAFGGDGFANKKILILEAERFRFQAAISDLSGSDIRTHKNEPVHASKETRDWLARDMGNTAPGASAIWARFNEFMADNYERLKTRGYSDEDISDQPPNELVDCMREWVEAVPNPVTTTSR